MCQLLGMNCNTPTDIVFSFEGFRRRGGLTDHHADGFGIAFFEGAGMRMFHDDQPSASSPVADLIKQYQIKSKNVIAHIRKATQGEISLANTHPFVRELWGQYWVFAHNGNLEAYAPERAASDRYTPVGTTDSEAAFCALMNHLATQFGQRPDDATLFAAIQAKTASIRAHGTFNFMLSNGVFLIAHATTHLHYIVRQAPFGEAQLVDDDVQVDFAQYTTPNDRVAVIATQPLTHNETWTPILANELLMFQDGLVVHKGLS
ncbi:MAG: class II glutamine amidotransferase [Neisseriaceae bacterium]|nr:class II glutamine amidotransferase [Neisseriaceae bacterium]